MSDLKRLLVAAAVAVALWPAAGSAAIFSTDLQAGQLFTAAEVLDPNELIEFRFNVLEALAIEGFAVSATGNGSGQDVAAIEFGFTLPPLNNFSTILTVNGATFGGGFLSGSIFAAGDVFSVFFSDGVTDPASITLSFETTAVPLPAAGLLLLTALVGGGLFARRARVAV